MGKTAKKVIGERKKLLENIKTCQSLNALEGLEYGYNNDSKYIFPKRSMNGKSDTVSLSQLKAYVRLANEIEDAFKAQKNKITYGLPQSDAESSQHQDVVESSDNEILVEGNDNIDGAAVLELALQELQNKRKKEIAHIYAELVNIDNKCERMFKKGPAYEAVTQATGRILDALTKLTEKYVKDGDLQHFQDETSTLFDETTEDMKTINEHRGWAKNFFGNLAYFILGLGVGYAAVCAYRGKFFEFNTDTANVVGVVNEKIAALNIG